MLSSDTHRRPVVSSALGIAAVSLGLVVSSLWNVTAWWRSTTNPLDQVLLGGAAVMAEVIALVALTLALHHARERRWGAALMSGLLLFGAVGWNITGGLLYQQQVAATTVAAQTAPALERATARLAAAEARIAAVPALPADAPGRRVEARNAQLAALMAERDAAEAAMRAAETADDAVTVGVLAWAKVALLEAVKAFGIFALGLRASGVATVAAKPADRLVSRKRSEAARKGVATRKRNRQAASLAAAVANDNVVAMPRR